MYEKVFTTIGFTPSNAKVKTNYTSSDMAKIKLEMLFDKQKAQ